MDKNIIALKTHILFILYCLNIIRKLLSLNVQTIFFFPFYHTGGAERVHLDIVKAAGKKKSVTFITNYSSNEHFLNEFQEYTCLFNISNYLGNQEYRKLLKYLLGIIGIFRKVTVFGSNSDFFYEILPNVGKKAKRIDLIHAFTFPKGGLEIFSLPYVKFLDTRIVINDKTKRDYIELYEKHEISSKFVDRIHKVTNMVNVPPFIREEYNKKFLEIIYCGRISEEKRVHLIVKIGELLPEQFKLKIVGPIQMNIDGIEPFYHGNHSSKEEINKMYRLADILLISSYREGFPMVVMEAMANGVVAICTDVGGIGEHIIHGQNGLLVSNYSDEDEIVEEFVKLIKNLETERNLLEKMSKNAYNYAKENFGEASFVKKYENIFKLNFPN